MIQHSGVIDTQAIFVENEVIKFQGICHLSELKVFKLIAENAQYFELFSNLQGNWAQLVYETKNVLAA